MRSLTRFSVIFAVTFIVNVAVIFLWGLIQSGRGSIDLTTSLVIAITVAIILTVFVRKG